MPRQRIGSICEKHGYVKGEYCEKCYKTPAKKATGIITNEWVTKTEWEGIDPDNPRLRVSSKEELFRHCERTGNYARAFMKPRSQGSGWEHKKRGA